MMTRPTVSFRIRGSLFLIAMSLLLSACGINSITPVKRTNSPDTVSTRYARAPASGEVVVQSGDTLYAISRRYGVPVREIVELNGLTAPYRLTPGQVLRLPGAREYRVRSGDTVSEIARDQGVDMHSLIRTNGLKPPYVIRVGQVLRLPGRTVVARTLPQQIAVSTSSDVTRSTQPTETRGLPPLPEPRPAGDVAGSGVASGSAPKPAPKPVVMSKVPKTSGRAATRKYTPPPRSGGSFQWPVRGRVISSFGAKKGGLYNDGINIAAKRGTAIKAAENGVVAYSGNELRGFGNLLLIKHSGGWTTAYAHADTFRVSRGDRVKRGQVIGTVGATGNVESPQLHFEIRKGQKAVNPKKHLAGATAISSPDQIARLSNSSE